MNNDKEIKTLKQFNDQHYFNGDYAFIFKPVIGGKVYNQLAETEDMALLLALGIKYLGEDSEFPKMAARMLNIKSAWTHNPESKNLVNKEGKIEVKEKFDYKNQKSEYYPVIDNKEYSYVGDTGDVAILLALGIKYEGLSSRFAVYACRMLNIDSVWAE